MKVTTTSNYTVNTMCFKRLGTYETKVVFYVAQYVVINFLRTLITQKVLQTFVFINLDIYSVSRVISCYLTLKRSGARVHVSKCTFSQFIATHCISQNSDIFCYYPWIFLNN